MKKTQISLTIFTVLVLLLNSPTPVRATTSLFYEGTRPLAMGGAFSAIADDENAKWWNPAGMVYLPRWQFDFRTMAHVSKETQQVIKTFPYNDILEVQKKVEDDEDILSVEETQDVLDYLEDLDEIVSLQEAVTLGLTLPRLGVKENLAIGISTYARAEIDDFYIPKSGLTSDIPAWVKLTAYQFVYDVKVDSVINLSCAYSLYDLTDMENTKAAAVGVNVKHLTRYRFTDVHDPYTVQDLLENDIKPPTSINDIPHASTLAFDIGTLCSPVEWVNFSLVAQDLGATLVYPDLPLEHIPANLKIGSAIYPLKYYSLGPISDEGTTPDRDYDVVLAFEVDDLSGQVRKDKKYLADKLHAGLEAKYSLFNDLFGIAVRAGSNQGFATYGAGLDLLWVLSIDYAYYGNEDDDFQAIEVGLTF